MKKQTKNGVIKPKNEEKITDLTRWNMETRQIRQKWIN